MARLLKWLGITLLCFAGLTAVAALWMGLEFGQRPAESVRPLAAAPDVRFVDANGIRFGYLEAGRGPLVLLFHGYPETARSWAAASRPRTSVSTRRPYCFCAAGCGSSVSRPIRRSLAA